MTNLQLGLTLSVVGPRGKLLEMDEWPMALRLTAGTDTEPDEAEALTLIDRTVPWELWKDLENGVQVAITPLDHTTPPAQPRDVHKPQDEAPEFLRDLKAEVVKEGKRLVEHKLLTFPFKPEHKEVVDDDEAARTGEEPNAKEERLTVPWPGLLATLQALVPPTPSALRCTWYFTLPRDWVATKDNDGKWTLNDVYCSAAPARVDAAAHDGYDVKKEDESRKYPVHVHKYKSSAVKAYCEALKLKSVVEHDLDEMDDFWLTILDSGDESLLDLGPRLDSACQPAALFASLSVDELVPAMVVEMQSNGSGTRAPTPPEAAAAIEDWKKQLGAIGKPAQIKQRILKAAADARTDQAGAARAEYHKVGVELVGKLSPFELEDPLTKVTLVSGHHEHLVTLAEGRVFPQAKRQPAARSPAEGIDLVVGDMSLRLRHAEDPEFGAVDDVAQIQLFGRRSTTLAQLDAQASAGGAPWFPLSAAQYRLPDKTSTSNKRLLGVTATYVDDVLCREVPYAGANIACANPLAGAHRESLEDDPLESFMLAAPDRVACTDPALRSLPLRYGDYYEFAAAVIDRAGGMAAEVTKQYPWELDIGKVPTLDPPQRDRVRYLRRSAVGDCNVMPGTNTRWPQTPAEVALRCLERLEPLAGQPAPTAILLAPERETNDRFRAAPNGRRPPHRYWFAVEAPRASEHVLLRWQMPATTLPDADRKAAADALRKQIAGILEIRDRLLGQGDSADEPDYSLARAHAEEVLPPDPAVAGIGLAWAFDSGAFGNETLGLAQTIELSCAGTSARASATSYVVAEGDFLRMRFYALVADEDLARFDPITLEVHLAEEKQQTWAGHKAFAPAEVFVETAASALPTVDAARLALEEDESGSVRVFYDFSTPDAATKALCRNVDQISIASERWVWRNLPVPPENGYAGNDEDRVRRLVSGPPKEIMDPGQRDTSAAVMEFDRLSEIDDGFVGRADQVQAYPRGADKRMLLAVDARDEHTHADYLRYSVAFRSRYAAVLREPITDWTNKRRIATGFRGDSKRIKPPRVLAVLPLTQSMPPPVGGDADTAPPFLVVLDEVWFREYGLGERLAARVANVKPEIPETPKDPPPERRYGPLPDHRLDLSGADEKLPLDVFGPFGMSHERSGSQALANATAFVVYPPAGTPPHFNMFAEFARVLDLPTPKHGGVHPASEFSEAVALYTLPDMAAIALGSAKRPLQLRADKADFTCAGADRLLPFPGANGEVMKQYRYVLVVGHHVRDGGRAVDVFLPSDALWLAPTGGDGLRARWIGKETRDVGKSGINAAVVLEIQLNGRFPLPANPEDDIHPLSNAEGLADLFRRMLDEAEGAPLGHDVGDAPGMIRRASAWFPLEVVKS